MISQQYDQKIQAWICENRERMIQMWFDLVRIPSVRSEPAPGAPYGIPCAQALKKATQYGEEMGLDVRVETDRGYSLMAYGDGEKTIGLFGHSDVVPAGDGWLYTEPFEPVIRDGVAIGRGCKDNKAGVMASLFATQIIKECQIPVKSRIQMFVGSNEECGMTDLISFVENEKMPELCLVPDARYPCCLGENGHLQQWNRSKTPLMDILNFHGDGAFNVVLNYAEVTLKNTPELLAELTAKTEGNDAYTVEQSAEGQILLIARGASKHSANPEGSVNAMILACKVLAQCDCLYESDRKQMQTVVALMDGYYGEGLGIAYEEEGPGKLVCSNGMVKMEDGKLCVSVDIRYGAGLPGKKLEEQLDKAWGEAGWELTWRENHHGAKVDPASKIPELLTSLTCEITGRECKPYWMRGGTYSRHLKNTYTVGAAVADPNSKAVLPEMPAGHGNAHQKDEYCIVDDWILGVRLLTHCILACDEAINA